MGIKLTYVTVGQKPRASWAADALDHYTKFLSKYADIQFRHAKPASSSLTNASEIIRIEGDRLIELLGTESGFMIACDKSGKSFDSETFAKKLQKGTDAKSGRAIIVIGGAWGLDQRVLDSTDLIWSFGPMTLPHELALIIACEQTARALSILRGDQYHK
jgi:23S rRNA (pseudouridine1915-N3)-methyltransferase